MNAELIGSLVIDLDSAARKKVMASIIATQVASEAATRIDGVVTAATYNHPASTLADIYNKIYEEALIRL